MILSIFQVFVLTFWLSLTLTHSLTHFRFQFQFHEDFFFYLFFVNIFLYEFKMSFRSGKQNWAFALVDNPKNKIFRYMIIYFNFLFFFFYKMKKEVNNFISIELCILSQNHLTKFSEYFECWKYFLQNWKKWVWWFHEESYDLFIHIIKQ